KGWINRGHTLDALPDVETDHLRVCPGNRVVDLVGSLSAQDRFNVILPAPEDELGELGGDFVPVLEFIHLIDQEIFFTRTTPARVVHPLAKKLEALAVRQVVWEHSAGIENRPMPGQRRFEFVRGI